MNSLHALVLRLIDVKDRAEPLQPFRLHTANHELRTMLPGTGFQNVGVQHIGEPLPLRAGQFFFLFKRYWLSALGMDERQLLSQLILENVPQRDIRVFRQDHDGARGQHSFRGEISMGQDLLVRHLQSVVEYTIEILIAKKSQGEPLPPRRKPVSFAPPEVW